MLSVDYQRILQAVANRVRLGQGPLTCQEMAALFGMDVVPARVEALRSKAKRLVARGWPSRRRAGSRALRAFPGQAAGHEKDHRPVDRRHLVDTAHRDAEREGTVRLCAVLSAESVTEGHSAQDYFRDRYPGLRVFPVPAVMVAGTGRPRSGMGQEPIHPGSQPNCIRQRRVRAGD